MAEETQETVENQETETPEVEIKPAQVEEAARKKGWRPLQEFEGDPTEWVDAREFVGRQPLYDKIHDLTKQISRQNQQFQRDMGVISKQFASMSDVAYKKALNELRADKALAIKDADIEAVEHIDTQIRELEHAQATAKVAPAQVNPGETPEMAEWKGKNSWFEKDKEMTDDAIALGIGYLAQHQGRKTQSEMLEFVETRIRKAYPEKFGKQQVTTTQKKTTTPVVEGNDNNSRPAPSRAGKLSVSDLSDDERMVMRTLIKRNALADLAKKNKRSQEEEYMAQLAEAKAR